jgi:hypothetical protein
VHKTRDFVDFVTLSRSVEADSGRKRLRTLTEDNLFFSPHFRNEWAQAPAEFESARGAWLPDVYLSNFLRPARDGFMPV